LHDYFLLFFIYSIIRILTEYEQQAEITHEQLTIELGSSRVVISRLLKEMEQKTYLSYSEGK